MHVQVLAHNLFVRLAKEKTNHFVVELLQAYFAMVVDDEDPLDHGKW